MADIWAAACTMFEAITKIVLFRGAADFSDTSDYGMQQQRKCQLIEINSVISRGRWKQRIHPLMAALLQKMIEFDPKRRATAEYLLTDSIFNESE